MTTLNANQASAKMQTLLEELAVSHEPVQIVGKRSNGVLISEEDWRALQETVYLLSIPGMRKSIREGLRTPVSKCSPKLRW